MLMILVSIIFVAIIRTTRCIPDDCYKPEEGDCEALGYQFYLNPSSGKCEEQEIGGCPEEFKGFGTLEECKKVCIEGILSISVDCFFPKSGLGVYSPCKALESRFYFNEISGTCQKKKLPDCLIYTAGFSTVKECQKECILARQEICKLPPVRGPCKAKSPRFFFNWRTSSCETFVFGGCSGNSNNFLTKEACLKMCVHYKPIPVPRG